LVVASVGAWLRLLCGVGGLDAGDEVAQRSVLCVGVAGLVGQEHANTLAAFLS
jgi:hypothetical protein